MFDRLTYITSATIGETIRNYRASINKRLVERICTIAISDSQAMQLSKTKDDKILP